MTDNNNHSQDRIEEVRKTLAIYFWYHTDRFERFKGLQNPKLYGSWSSMITHLIDGKPATPIELIGLVGAKSFAEISEVNTAEMSGHELKYLKELWYDFIKVGIGKKGIDDETLDFINKVRGKFAIANSNEKGNVDECVALMEEKAKLINERGMLGISTSHQELDNVSGGFQEGTMWAVGGYSGSGKSKFAYSVIHDLIDRGYKVCFFSLEITKYKLLANILAPKLGRTVDEILRMKFDPKSWPELANLTIFSEKTTVEAMVEIMRDTKFDFVFVDYVQCVQTERDFGASNNVQQESYVARSLFNAARDAGTCLIGLSQVNKASRMESGANQNLKGSNTFYELCNFAMVISKDKDNPLLSSIHVIKNRDGVPGKSFSLIGDWATNRLEIKTDVFQ